MIKPSFKNLGLVRVQYYCSLHALPLKSELLRLVLMILDVVWKYSGIPIS